MGGVDRLQRRARQADKHLVCHAGQCRQSAGHVRSDPEQIHELGLIGVEELGEAVYHAWSINAGELERVVQWFRAPRVKFVGKHCSELIRAGRIGPVLT